MSRLKLQFPGESEAAFRAEFFRKSLRPIRFILVIAILLFGSFIPFDYWILPLDTFFVVTAIRMVTLVFLLGILAFTLSSHFERWWQLAVVSVSILFGMSVALMVAANPPESDFSYVSGPAFLLFIMVTFTIIRLRFAYATVTSGILIVIYNVVMILTEAVPVSVLLGNDLMLLSGFVLGMAAAYQLRGAVRRVDRGARAGA